MQKDMMQSFELYQPDNLDAALSLTDRYGKDGWLLSGGNDSLDWFKDRVKRPTAVIDLGGITSLRGISEIDDGILIGAQTTLTEIVDNPIILERYGLLAKAAAHVATPQIRNMSSIGGNLIQDTRCWYYRAGLDCYRAGGTKCYADTPEGMNREHCLFNADRCVAVSPSDTAPALIAVDAKMVVESNGGSTVHDAEDFFIGPAIDITRMTVMKSQDLLTRIHIPARWADADFYYEKIRDRGSWDFQLVSVAAAFRKAGGTIEEARISVNGVAPFPVRLDAVERLVQGTSGDESTASDAGELAIQGARPLRHNEYKVTMMRNLVRRAVRSVS